MFWCKSVTTTYSMAGFQYCITLPPVIHFTQVHPLMLPCWGSCWLQNTWEIIATPGQILLNTSGTAEPCVSAKTWHLKSFAAISKVNDSESGKKGQQKFKNASTPKQSSSYASLIETRGRDMPHAQCSPNGGYTRMVCVVSKSTMSMIYIAITHSRRKCWCLGFHQPGTETCNIVCGSESIEKYYHCTNYWNTNINAATMHINTTKYIWTIINIA